MIHYAITDVGNVREENQDSYYLPESTEKLKLYIIADGMGGCNGGKEASTLAINIVKKYIEENIDLNITNKEDILLVIKNAISFASEEIYKKSKQEISLEGMGTTIDVALIHKDRAYIGHVGDSRIYRIRKNIIRQLTKDHSYVEKLIEDGKITREESYNHPEKNLITKALGCMQDVEADVSVKGLLKGDILILCTDGLINMLSNEEIKEIVENKNLDVACNILIEKAKEKGGYDNITTIIIKN